ncbi:MAG: TatD family hydrolase [Acidobacteriota bacterium]
MLIDSHAHLASQEFHADREAVIQRAVQAGVERILVIGGGSAAEGFDSAIRLAEKHPEVDASIGIHPHEAATAEPRHYAVLSRLAEHQRIVAWGEIGLDFHYNHSPRDIQKAAFRSQLRLARESGLPVIVHTREAEMETLELLKESWTSDSLGGILHCFTGSLGMARECVELGFWVSFSGILTFPKSVELRQVARALPLDRLLIETDSPYLAPAPHRGKRNEPAFVVETARALSVLHGVSMEEVAERTRENYLRFRNQARRN